MTLLERISQDILTAMRAKDELKLNTLRSVKTALDRYRTDQRKPADEKAEQQILGTLAKQRRESATAFGAAGRDLLETKELAELAVLEEYMPKEATEEEVDAVINAAIHELQNSSTAPVTEKSMGVVMKAVQERLSTNGKRTDGKVLSVKIRSVLTSLTQPMHG